MKKSLFFIFIFYCANMSAQNTLSTTAPASTPAPASTTEPGLSPKNIVSISFIGNDSVFEAPIGGKIKVKFDTLYSDMSGDYFLYINSIPFKKIKTYSNNGKNAEMIFELIRSQDTDGILKNLYSISSPAKKVRISVGTEKGPYVGEKEFTIVLFDVGLLIAGIILIILLIGSFLFLNSRYPIIKAESILPDKFKPYSLARAQLAWWSVIIIASFIFLICITRELTTITGSSVILLTISAATFAATKMIDNANKKNSEISDQAKAKKGFFIDLLSDEQGVSMPRFQNIAFNIVIGLYFLYVVITELKMPEIDSSLLALMGVSSGTYALLKTNENKSTATADTGKDGSQVREDDDDVTL